MIRRATFLIIVMLLSAVAFAAPAGKKYTLVIDAGHGGKDPGAPGSFSYEKDINLAVALAFGRYVEENCSDVNVVYTRKTDVFVTLQGRADIANKAKADLFISIHTNSAKGKSARGFSTYTLGMHRAADNLEVAKRENDVIELENDYKTKYHGFDPNSSESYIMFEFLQDKNMEKSVKLARYIQDSVCSLPNRENRKVHQAGFLVLRETSMPSCLLELGFITNDAEERELNDKYTQDQIARSIYQAFVEYKDATSGLRSTGKINVAPHVSASLSTVNSHTATTTEAKPAASSLSQAKPSAPQTKKEQKPTVAAARPEPKKTEPAKTEPKKAEPAKQEPKKADAPKTATKPVATAAKTEQKPQPKQKPQPVAQAKTVNGLIFKIQILSGSVLVNQNDPRLNDTKNVEYTIEDGVYKYTVGSSADYNEIYKLKVKIQEDFPQSFIVAYRDGKKVVLKEAIEEWKKKQ